MSELARIQRMLHPFGGRATVTISNPRGGHATFRIKQAAKGKHSGRTFVEVPDESAQWGWRGVGSVTTATLPYTFQPYSGTTKELAYAVQLVLNALAAEAEPEYLMDVRGGPYTVQAANTCGACGRELTHPDSIPVGIGPECAAKLGSFHPGYSSQHVATRNQKQAS